MNSLEISAFKRDRIAIVSTIIVVAALAWLYMFHEAWGMEQGWSSCCLPRLQAWSVSKLLMVFVMWTTMMVAMMLPSVTPMALTFAMVNRKRQEREDPVVPTWIFLLGYLIVWTLFSALITILQGYLHNQALLSTMMVSTSPLLSGMLLISAGIFQFTPLKNTCLSHCRSPLSFLLTDWQEGKLGALVMGLRHGLFCTGCCWILMMLLFVLGVMNLWWIAILSIFILLEKLTRRDGLHQISGSLLIGWGIALIFVPHLR